ncbi:alpha/beta hydrolase [Nocardia sp. NBC_00511]|uniref:alpha/beta hydrolase n=1 Tax=Nocardia sp. NBC_00511 TaxID=2903591 RepID=UPI0030DEDD76
MVWVGAGTAVATAPAAGADPASTAHITDIVPMSDTLSRVYVDTPEMGSVQVLVSTPRDRDASRPTLYMLDGGRAYGDGSWLRQGRAMNVIEGKPVNVVFTLGGAGSYFTDWERTDPGLGVNKWETFLTRELPPLIDAAFEGNGIDAIAGVSMGAQGAMMLAERAPRLYRGVAAYSGCYTSTGVEGQAQMRGVVTGLGGDPGNMFGGPADPAWADHDVLAHADALRGKDIYVSVGNGVLSDYEAAESARIGEVLALGVPIELAAHQCTVQFADRLGELGIPATTNFRSHGTHIWAYWADDFADSWPVLARALRL